MEKKETEEKLVLDQHHCTSCGGTGERYIGALAGDGWTGRTCDICDGYGGYYTDKDGGHYVMCWTSGAAAGPVLRGDDGRFVSTKGRLPNYPKEEHS
jgi:hypothetical protein